MLSLICLTHNVPFQRCVPYPVGIVMRQTHVPLPTTSDPGHQLTATHTGSQGGACPWVLGAELVLPRKKILSRSYQILQDVLNSCKILQDSVPKS